jgi:hypothetical protein
MVQWMIICECPCISLEPLLVFFALLSLNNLQSPLVSLIIQIYSPVAVKTDVIENQAGGVQNFASFARVPGGGHLVSHLFISLHV